MEKRTDIVSTIGLQSIAKECILDKRPHTAVHEKFREKYCTEKLISPDRRRRLTLFLPIINTKNIAEKRVKTNQRRKF